MDIFQNICIAALGMALTFAVWKIYAMSIAISGLREFYEEYSKENARMHSTREDQFSAVARGLEVTQGNVAKLGDTVRSMQGDVDNLKNGIVPDYEAARQAAAATNDFFTGVSNIMGFDPMAAARKEREGDGV